MWQQNLSKNYYLFFKNGDPQIMSCHIGLQKIIMFVHVGRGAGTWDLGLGPGGVFFYRVKKI